MQNEQWISYRHVNCFLFQMLMSVSHSHVAKTKCALTNLVPMSVSVPRALAVMGGHALLLVRT